MRKRSYFDEFIGREWPAPSELEHYFLAPPGECWKFRSRNDCWGLSAEGVDGTEHLPEGKGRIDIHLTMVGNVDHGVLLQYRKWGGGLKDTYYSKGDLGRLRDWVKTNAGDLMPIGLYIPFEKAWSGVKQFIEGEGTLPKSIAWIADRDVPEYAFPDPAAGDIAEGRS
jgi:hypothetical protein